MAASRGARGLGAIASADFWRRSGVEIIGRSADNKAAPDSEKAIR